MHAAFGRVDVVRVREDRLGVGVGPLQRALDRDAVALAVGRDDRMQRIFLVVEVFHERHDAAVVHEGPLARLFGPLVA